MSNHNSDEPDDAFGGEEGKDYEVGYGKPPKHSQFKPDNKMSKGRKKGSKGMKTVVNKAFGAKILAKKNGKPTKMSKFEAAMDQLANQAAQGNQKAIDKSIPLYERYGPQDDPEGPSAERVEANLDAMAAYFAMKRQTDGSEEEDDGG